MATDVEVQFFSHLNGLTLGNNWGDLIRLLDTCLVNGLPLTSITAASIDAQGDIHLTTYAAHNSMLFQIVELSGFVPSELNGKYRIKGVPSANQLILKAEHVGKAITTTGAAKLASLGYEIIFRDTNDVKRVYRAKNPTAQHPFIRVDETISDGTNSYATGYAKYAMVGLLEHMEHIDDYGNQEVLQLPLDTTNLTKNWSISGTGTAVVRGWSRWYWSVTGGTNDYFSDTSAPNATARNFTLCGDKDAFYFMPAALNQVQKQVYGAGIYDDVLEMSNPWFLISYLGQTVASTSRQFGSITGGQALTVGGGGSAFFAIKNSSIEKAQITAYGLLPDNLSGNSGIYNSSNIPALDIPTYDTDKFLRGTLKHIKYMGKAIGSSNTTVELGGSSMYVKENARQATNTQSGGATCGFYFYLGELE